MGDSLLMHLCGNQLEVGQRQKGIGSVGRLVLLAYMVGCLTICETCMFCPLSGRVNHCFSCPRVIGLIQWLWFGEYGFSIVGIGVIL